MASSGSLDAFVTFSQAQTDKRAFDIKGETQDSIEKGFGSCQLVDYQLGFSLDIAPGRETDTKASEKATHEPNMKQAQLTKAVDAASPTLMQALVEAAHFDWISIWQKKAGASKGKSGDYFWKVYLYEAYIAELNWRADSDNLTETLSIEYKKVEVEYYKQLPTGALDKQAITGEYTDIGVGSKKDKGDGSVDADAVEKRILEKLKKLNPNLRIS